MIRALAFALLFAFAGLVAAAAPLRFADATEEARFRALVSELRCVMCQNQSLADSDAQIARDLRAQVLQLMRDGRSDTEIKDYLVDRYSERKADGQAVDQLAAAAMTHEAKPAV